MDKKILVVDDSQSWLNYHRDTLTELFGDSYIIETADSGRAGYDKIYANLNPPYSLIISDLQMELDFEPLHAGEWFVERVKEMTQYRNIPIVLISATFNIKNIAESLEVNYLPKAIAARNLTAYKLAIEEAMN